MATQTLYDVLEVSQSASADAIGASYRRLHTRYTEQAAAGDDDATNRMVALREAFATLSDPARRQRYDDNLAFRASLIEAPAAAASRPWLKPLLIAAVIGLSAIGYQKYQAEQAQARLEAERSIAATRLAEAEARQAAEERAAAELARRQALREQAIERANRERDLAYGEEVTRRRERAEAEARREKLYDEQRKQRDEQQKQYDADRQLAREKAYLRQIEAEKSRYPRYY